MEKECEEGEMEKKLRRSFTGYSRRAAPSTPPPTWRLEFSPPHRVGASSAAVETKEFLTNPEVSVRKLCADLWETEQFRQRIGLRRCRRRDSDVVSPSCGPLHDHQPPSRGSLRRQIVATCDHGLVRRNGDLLQPISPASCTSSSLEVVMRRPAFSQTGSSVVKSASYGLGSSTKLLKVLNRIWSLEEQNTANMSLVRALKMELDECRAEIKEVQQREKQSDRRGRKLKEEEAKEVKGVFRSMKKDLDDERKIRKQSETLHRKLTREVCEAKHCLSKALKDLEKERQERVVVENLCDEFAKAVKDYEDKARRVGNKSPMSDKVIVQIAEVWNDQRLQMKLEEDDKGIETFLRRKEKSRSHSSKGSGLRAKPDDSVSMHQRVCLKELEEGIGKRTRRDNKLQLKKSSGQVLNLSMSSEGDKIYPESSPRTVDDHENEEKSRTFSRIRQRNVNVAMGEDKHRTLKDKLMEARVESRRLRSPLKPELSPSDLVQG
ncbi:hypothetical protein CARUB_v10023089mg [Capsella rubella]|uniref:Uncharacterized protein n=1 Tax=Capsella rubella TaxID=81985 RepID=R0HC61_9BRAS|nr:uncharacterized protein At5g41620 [Capsella rubella]EOA26994.1 hypothetical protein CARUB_v10023089mg [Capsella rubella]